MVVDGEAEAPGDSQRDGSAESHSPLLDRYSDSKPYEGLRRRSGSDVDGRDQEIKRRRIEDANQLDA